MTKVGQTLIKSEFSNHLIGCFDIGKNKQYAYAEAPNGKYLKVFSFDNNLAGFQDCYNRLEQFRKEENLSGILMGAESTGSYGEPLTAWLQSKGLKMVGVNSKHVHRLKEVIDNSPLKSDKKDPIVGTRIVQQGAYYNPLIAEGIAGELREQTKHRKDLKEKMTRATNQLESQIVRVFPEFIKVMKWIGSKTSLGLLADGPLPDDIIALGEKQLTEKIEKLSRKKLGNERAKELLKAAVESIGITEGTISISMYIKDLVEEYNFFATQLKKVDLAIQTLLPESDEARLLMSHPGIGFVTAAEIIGETGGLANYSNSGKLMKLAGLNLFEISSGVHKGKRRITKRGRSALRQTLYLAGLRMCKKGSPYRAQYEKHLKTMKKPQAVIAIAKKLFRVLFALVKKNELFDPAYIQSQK